MLAPLGCRARADECRRMAVTAQNISMQSVLIDMSRTWGRLAIEVEAVAQIRVAARPLARADLVYYSGQLVIKGAEFTNVPTVTADQVVTSEGRGYEGCVTRRPTICPGLRRKPLPRQRLLCIPSLGTA
jgi:hypothetical protein